MIALSGVINSCEGVAKDSYDLVMLREEHRLLDSKYNSYELQGGD